MRYSVGFPEPSVESVSHPFGTIFDHIIQRSNLPGLRVIPADRPHAIDGDREKQMYGGRHAPHLDNFPGHRPECLIDSRREIGDQWKSRNGFMATPWASLCHEGMTGILCHFEAGVVRQSRSVNTGIPCASDTVVTPKSFPPGASIPCR